MNRSLMLLTLYFLVAGCNPRANITQARNQVSNADEKLIRVLFDSYITAIKTADRNALTAAFHPSARMYGYYKQYDNNMPIADYIDLQIRKGPSPSVVTQIHSLEITGRIAQLKVVSTDWNVMIIRITIPALKP